VVALFANQRPQSPDPLCDIFRVIDRVQWSKDASFAEMKVFF